MNGPVLVLAGESPLPADSGLRQRILHVTRALAGAFDVELVALGDAPGADGEPFRLHAVPHARSRFTALVRSARRPYQTAKVASDPAREHVASGTWRTVQCELPFLAPMVLGATNAPLVLDAHNVESDLLRTVAAGERRPIHRVRWLWEASKTTSLEREVASRAAAVCATSDGDAARFEALGARRVVVAPNGVDCSALEWRPPPAGCACAYVGHFGYRPNVAAALELVREILPLVRRSIPDASALLVGRDPPRELTGLHQAAVEVTGAVPSVLPHLRRARALVVPLRSGGGTRLKVLEALAAGVPVVSTPFGVAGLAVEDGTHVLLGRTAAELASQTIRVMRDHALAAALSAEGRRLAEERYDWRVVTRPIVALHAELGGAA